MLLMLEQNKSHVVDAGRKQKPCCCCWMKTKAILLKSEQNKSLAVDAGRKIKFMLSKKCLLANIITVIQIYKSKEEELTGG